MPKASPRKTASTKANPSILTASSDPSSKITSASPSKRHKPSPPPPKHAATSTPPSRTARRSTAKPAAPLIESPAPAAAGSSKQSRIITLLQQPAGASLDDLMHATGWQAHSVRGVISGVLRKRLKLAVIAEKADSGERRYCIKDKP